MDRNLILNDGFNALVFEHRHKNYGAYQIRKRYSRSVLLSAFIATSIFTLAMGSYFISGPKAMAAMQPPKDSLTIVTMVIPPDEPKHPKIDPQFTPPSPKGPKVNPAATPQVVDRPVDPKPVTDSVPGDPHGVIGIQGPINHDPPCINCKGDSLPPVPPIDPPVVIATDPPQFDVQKWFTDHTKYPERAKAENIEGIVYLQWIVDTDGKITDIVVAKAAHPWLNAEALRVAKLMPKWDPAKDHGKTVRFKFTMPVHFKLQ